MHFPQLADFWKSMVGALVTQAVKMVTMKLLYPLFEMVPKAKAKDDPVLRRKYATKACEYGYGTL